MESRSPVLDKTKTMANRTQIPTHMGMRSCTKLSVSRSSWGRRRFSSYAECVESERWAQVIALYAVYSAQCMFTRDCKNVPRKGEHRRTLPWFGAFSTPLRLTRNLKRRIERSASSGEQMQQRNDKRRLLLLQQSTVAPRCPRQQRALVVCSVFECARPRRTQK